MLKSYSVTIIGSGNWATVVANNVGINAKFYNQFHDTVNMYVPEEVIAGRNLTEIINETHENIKYLPGLILPENIVAIPDLVASARNADIIIFIVPCFTAMDYCKQLLGKIKPTACAVSLVRGFDRSEDGNFKPISHIIQNILKVSCSMLVGCNMAPEILNGNYIELTIGCRDQNLNEVFRNLFKSDTVRVEVSEDADTVELCASLRNIIAFGIALATALNMNDNIKAGIVRRGLIETIHFVDLFYPGSRYSSFFLPSGISDFITASFANTYLKTAKEFLKKNVPLKEIKSFQKMEFEGPSVIEMVASMINSKDMKTNFPFFSIINDIYTRKVPVSVITHALTKAQPNIYKPNMTLYF